MPTLKDFEDLIAETTNVSNQFATAGKDGLAFKGKGARLATFLSSSHQTADKAMLESFFKVLKEAYGPEAAMAGFKKAGLTRRVVDGDPLSVKEATLALREAKAIATPLIRMANAKHQEKHATLQGDARNWDPHSTFSRVQGSGLRLVTQDQGEFRLHHWNAKNNPDEPIKKKTVELDVLVEREVAAIKASRQQAERDGRVLEPMSDRLIYLQAKLNLTERMVAEACLPGNLKEGGPSANVFLGPDMFFSPSDGPGVPGSCEKTTGGACTEEEMKGISEGLRRISARHPQITLMPGTIVWSKPVDPVPIIDGVPRPADMAYNTGPVFSNGSLAHMTYKMTDGGDANTTAIGINDPGGSAATAPSPGNQFGARLQVFPEDGPTMAKLTKDGKAKVQPILATMARQATPLSTDRDWEVGLRPEDAGPRSSYNTIFTVGDKVMALEICRDNSNRQAQKDYARLLSSKDPVAVLAKSQPGPNGGANLHVMLAAVSTLAPSCTICCSGGIAAYNDIGKGLVQSYPIKGRDKYERAIVDPGEKQEMSYHKYDSLKESLSSKVPTVGLSSVDVKRDDSVRLGPSVAPVSATGVERPPLERPPGSGLGLPVVERPPDPELDALLARMPNVRDVLRAGTPPSTRSTVQSKQLDPEESPRITEKRNVRSASRLDGPKPKASTGGGTVSVATKL